MQKLHKWKGLRLEIAEYCRDNQIAKEDFRFLDIIDYYIADKKFKWLITENHHDFVQFLGEGLDVNVIETVCTVTHENARIIGFDN